MARDSTTVAVLRQVPGGRLRVAAGEHLDASRAVVACGMLFVVGEGFDETRDVAAFSKGGVGDVATGEGLDKSRVVALSTILLVCVGTRLR